MDDTSPFLHSPSTSFRGSTSKGAQIYVRKRPVESRMMPTEGYAALMGLVVAAAVFATFSLRRRQRDRGP